MKNILLGCTELFLYLFLTDDGFPLKLKYEAINKTDMNLVAVEYPFTFSVHVSQRDVTDKGSKVFTSDIFMTAWNSTLVSKQQCVTSKRIYKIFNSFQNTSVSFETLRHAISPELNLPFLHVWENVYSWPWAVHCTSTGFLFALHATCRFFVLTEPADSAPLSQDILCVLYITMRLRSLYQHHHAFIAVHYRPAKQTHNGNLTT